MKSEYNKIYKKLENKKVIIYGAGKFFHNLNFDFSKLNIVGIVDKKFLVEDEGQLYAGFPIIPLQYFEHNIADYILIALEKPECAVKELSKFIPNKKLISFIKPKKECFFDKFKNRHNTFVLIKKDGKKVFNPRIKNLKVKMYGENNYIEIHEPFDCVKNVYISCKSNSKITIGARNRLKEAEILVGSNNELSIGKNILAGKISLIMKCSKNTKLTIGDDCMLGYNVIIRTEDGHTVYDCNTKEILNAPQDVYIGNHVWIITNTTILKGSYIADNNIIAGYSIVNQKFENKNCIIAGTPAKIIKRGVNWDRRSTGNFQTQ